MALTFGFSGSVLGLIPRDPLKFGVDIWWSLSIFEDWGFLNPVTELDFPKFRNEVI